MKEFDQRDVGTLLNALHDGVCCLSTQGELLYANAIAQKHWKPHFQHPGSLLLLSPVARAMAGEPVYHVLVRSDESHTLLLNTLPLYRETNAITAILIISQDVSAQVLLQHQAELSLNVLVEAVMQTQELRDADEALRRLAALLLQLDSIDTSFAFHVDESTGRLRPLALLGSSQQTYEEWSAELSALEVNTEQTLQSSPAYLQALRLQHPLLVDFTAPSVEHRPRQPRAAIYAPVLLNGHVLGLLGAERHRPLGEADMYFPRWSIDLLKALARLASMAIEKMSLVTRSSRQQEEIEMIRNLLRQKDTFLSLAAHELKNPLTAIRGEAQVLQRRIRRSLPPEQESNHELLRGLKSIERQTQRIVHMMDTLLDVSRLDLERLELELREVDLIQLARRTLTDYLPLVQKHELRLNINGRIVPLEEGGGSTMQETMTIVGDEERLEQVIVNLISNAVKYSPQGGPVTLLLRRLEDGGIEIAVEDQGIGIPPEEQERLTERFFRAQNAQNVDAKGLGLGLYLVNALVIKHKGTFAVKSEGVPGKGSTFIVRLPSL